MKNYVIILMVIFCSSSSLVAQNKLSFDYTGKLLVADFSGLNSQINGKYPTLDHGIINEFQVGWSVVSQRGTFGLHGNVSSILNQERKQKQTLFSGYGFGIKYTYNVLKESSIKLSPELDFGLRKYKLVLGDTANGVSVEDVLNYPINNYVFSNLGAYLDLGLGLSKNFKIKIQKNIYYDLSIGLSGGYRFDKGKWLYEGINPVYHETANLSGAYFDIKATMGILNTEKENVK